MKIDHYENDPKQSPTAQSLIQGEINALVTFWPDVRDDEAIGPEVAFDLLAIWAHLRRFDASTLDDDLFSRINVFVANDFEAICEQALRFTFPPEWPDIARQLDEAWDHAVEAEEVDELEHAVNEHFELLDRGSLVAYALADLEPTTCGGQRFAEMKGVLHNAESYLADHPDVFLPAAVFASSMLDSYRQDLNEFDKRLWETTLKHRVIQELVDEQQNPTLIPKMSRVIAKLLMDITPTDAGNTISQASSSGNFQLECENECENLVLPFSESSRRTKLEKFAEDIQGNVSTLGFQRVLGSKAQLTSTVQLPQTNKWVKKCDELFAKHGPSLAAQGRAADGPELQMAKMAGDPSVEIRIIYHPGDQSFSVDLVGNYESKINYIKVELRDSDGSVRIEELGPAGITVQLKSVSQLPHFTFITKNGDRREPFKEES